MWPLFVRRKCAFVRVDVGSAVLIPFIALTVAILLGHIVLSIGAVKSVYSSPFVALSAIVSNRVCLRAGLITAAGAVVAHEFFFAAPYLHLGWPSPEQSLAYGANFAAAYLVARRTPLPPQTPPHTNGTTPLPFVGTTTTPPEKSFWVVSGGRDWSEDCIVGSEYARLYLDHACTPLPWIVRDMVAAGKWTGVEVGFCSVIGRAASVGRRNIDLPTSLPHDDADDFEPNRPVV